MNLFPRFGVALLLIASLCVSCDSPTHEPRTGAAQPGSGSGALGLATEWPFEGPPRLWARTLGPGYSGIVVNEDRLYTMYRFGNSEIVICLDAGTGETVWEHSYVSTPVDGQDIDYGEGPNAAPLLADGRLYTIGFAGVMHCLDPASGDVLWSHDLRGELGGNVVELGYSASPVEYADTIIALVGDRGQGAVAFDKQDGHVVWKNLDFEASYATPAIMKIHGEDQLVAFMATEIVGADPNTGELLWQYAIRNQYPQNICAPIQVDEDLVFISTGEAGSRGLRLVKDDAYRVEELWSTTKVQCFYGSFVLVGDIIYGTSGFQSGPRMSAINARTGELVWRSRGFDLSHVVAVGDFLVLLDDEGKLSLATPGPDGLEVHAKARVLSSPALTPPTLHQTVLYARDQSEIVALELASTNRTTPEGPPHLE
jgi:outer membrane protein assembly factor BamB